MKAQDAQKITEEALQKTKDTRLDKYVEYLERDIVAAARLGKFKFVVDYMNKPFKDEFILGIQDVLIANGFKITTDEDPAKFRRFTISWNDETE